MSDPHTQPLDDTDDLLAAEYVLGVLPLPVRSATEQRLKRDPAFAAAVQDWENRMEGLNENYAPIKAPDLMPAIEARLFGASVPARRPLGEMLAKSIGGSLRAWLAGVGAAAALVLLLVAFVPFTPPAPLIPLATLAAEALDLRYEITREGDALRAVRVAGAAPEAGRVHELWLIVGDAAPVSLGVIADGGQLPGGADLLPDLAAGMVFAISLEPTGGSPTGAPTGPVLVTGVITQG